MVHSVSGWTRGVEVKLWDPLRTRALPERLTGVSRQGAIQIHVYLYLYLYLCASLILRKFVPNCWSAHAETATAKPNGPCAWDDDIILVGWSQSRTSSNDVYKSVHITKVLRTSAMHQCNKNMKYDRLSEQAKTHQSSAPEINIHGQTWYDTTLQRYKRSCTLIHHWLLPISCHFRRL